eukprot:scaffold93526_cov33-Tisochrysis_lutea.AAC.3
MNDASAVRSSKMNVRQHNDNMGDTRSKSNEELYAIPPDDRLIQMRSGALMLFQQAVQRAVGSVPVPRGHDINLPCRDCGHSCSAISPLIKSRTDQIGKPISFPKSRLRRVTSQSHADSAWHAPRQRSAMQQLTP